MFVIPTWSWVSRKHAFTFFRNFYFSCVLAVICFIGFSCAIFLPETLHQKLPNTLNEAKMFGHDQVSWNLFLCQNPQPVHAISSDNKIYFSEILGATEETSAIKRRGARSARKTKPDINLKMTLLGPLSPLPTSWFLLWTSRALITNTSDLTSFDIVFPQLWNKITFRNPVNTDQCNEVKKNLLAFRFLPILGHQQNIPKYVRRSEANF